MLNRIVLIGRLTADPELRYTQSGIAVARFTIAVDRAYKSASGERETDFIDIVVWRQHAETCAKYLSKGKLAAVDGSLHIRNYEGKDGVRRRAAEVQADTVRFLSPRDGSSTGYTQSVPTGGYDVGNDAPFDQGGIAEDDLPF